VQDRYQDMHDPTLCRTGIMGTYWCCKKNSIIDNYLKLDLTPALVPCIGPGCPRCHNRVKMDAKNAR